MATALIILAAGEGSRMLSDAPKVLHELAGAPLLAHAIASGSALEPERVVVVTGHGSEQVAAAAREIDPDIRIAVQSEQLGTGHAVAQATAEMDGFTGDVVVLYGDTPLIRPETLAQVQAARETGADLVVLGFDAADPARYGRLVADGDTLERIVEYKDATEAERAITLCNSGIMLADATRMLDWIGRLGNDNASGEYYLTDIVEIARADGAQARVVTCPEAETLGVNTRADLAYAEAAFQARARGEALDNGVTLTAPETVFFAADTVIGRDAVIEPNVVFGSGVTVETGARIRAFSHLEGCHVARGAVVGPYARLRPGAELAEGAKIGNFVEVKNALIAEGAKVNHLSYIGDAEIGAAANIGAGTITCNYDGVFKHKTRIGSRAFIGSNTMLVAPVTIGNDAMTGCGSVVTEDVPDEALAIARSRQVTKPGLAKRMMDRLKALKAKQKKDG
ncbi:bifunctional UDP-N-acetylglucosamine diphosphorylase/glucosamine-1-phosphate N-acetyltransferase GlmU [Qingshengfaniella alkalisoli]|uniref:Bifunctional protein GlmU n=1 Tax=Qingshengfaniella alkalisoli TaxID=2599296 RepID=A0A5B8J2F6_9RHOB|nr:bifunctional UDP-N-acetylglucosamine diphosphorylase/glucosamine-1-phosphate N-acetyltransferase GlmU [Qingshengfaniella alkalisoli]QDY70958.1 bifunctional UDP-N-acetylglucosamine diphosphorylase/glucosamine-1-phosphate N-acetyltransferase GlmU [Qingshengfaniella alkalisoli]